MKGCHDKTPSHILGGLFEKHPNSKLQWEGQGFAVLDNQEQGPLIRRLIH
jgi:hypothetical protein